MNEVYIYIILSFLTGAIIAWLITQLLIKSSFNKEKQSAQHLFQQKETELKTTNAGLSAERDHKIEQLTEKVDEVAGLKSDMTTLQYTIEDHIRKLTKAEQANENLQERMKLQKEEMETLQAKFTASFKNLAQEILDENSKKFKETNKEEIDKILNPLNKEIKEFKQQVDKVYKDEAKERHSLKDEVRNLAELNAAITLETKNLVRALRSDSKAQGGWGEMILESILEKSGLQKGVQYEMQHTLRDEDGKPLLSDSENKKMVPDAIINYPGDRKVIVDSKVSLTAFASYLDSDNPDKQNKELKNHISSVKRHIDQLSHKGYDDYDKSLDFVVMFMPSEPAYIAAMQGDKDLWQYAYDRRILLLSPTNLITSLKLIVDLWKRELQNKNAMKVAEQGGKIYDKLTGFISTFQDIEKAIDSAKGKYDKAWGQLKTGRGNLVSQVDKLKGLGVKIKSQKALPEVETYDDLESDNILLEGEGDE